MRNFTCVACLLVLTAVSAESSMGAIINVTSHVNDATSFDSNTDGVGNSTFEISSSRLLVGGGGSGHFAGIMYFQLPAFGPNEFIADANLRLTVTLDSLTTVAQRADIYGLGYNTTTPPATMPTSWFYQGANDTRNGNTLGTNIGLNPVTKIADDFLVGGTSIPSGTAFNTSALQDAVLLNYINSLYAQGAEAGDYAVFRANLDANPAGSPPSGIRFELASANHATATFRPLLTFDIQDLPPVPEPSSILLLGMGMLGLQAGRRRRSSVTNS